ncbi:hypothetical protein [Kurthia massiliensis]|uniref:hypothetical protein n=1 Tax=Kurthia massiliensis TaxID=1033739 RepID=UPI0002892E74|nr:hypothetical protein [Kurthia massiliensis]
MHVLTTDLDRTFIFSERTVGLPLEEAICIEKLHDRPISYISKRTKALLEEAQQHIEIIPVTTRSRAQYDRIQLFDQTPHYAVVCNGGIVLNDGEIDREWQAQVQKNIASCMGFEAFRETFAHCWEMEMFRKINEVDGLFYVMLIDEEKRDDAALTKLAESFEDARWTSYVHGRKFYALPKTLTKEAAVQYVLEKLAPIAHYAAGDSFMDLGMMQLTEHHYSPQHGEIYGTLAHEAPIRILEMNGAAFTEQMLEEILEAATSSV